MDFSLNIVTEPTSEPVTLVDVKRHLRIDWNHEDVFLSSLITSAREVAEGYAQRAFITQTLRYTLDGFLYGGIIDLPRPPLQSITSIQYVDTDGVTQTLDASKYRVDTDSSPGRLTPAYNEVWPATQDVTASVTITYVAGYGAVTDVPAAIKSAILLIIGDMYVNRDTIAVGVATSQLPLTAERLLSNYRCIFRF